MKAGFYTLGCKLNFSETSTLARQFKTAGFERVSFEEFADVYVINTCSVTDNADKKCRNIVRGALKRNPGAFVIVVGCYAQLKPEEIAAIPGVDAVLGANEKFRALELIDDWQKREAGEVIAGEISQVNGFVEAFSAGDRTRSFLKIQDGCDYKCTFCTIPLARGKSRSDQLENVVKNARKIAASGIKEIVLTGVNTGDYGKDQPHKFLDVLKAIEDVDGIERVRISSIEPNLIIDEIIEFASVSRKLMPHFHIPLQSGNNELLGKMRRRYRRELYQDRVTKILSLMPDASIGVDVIVGFPGESNEHFMDTYEFLHSLDVGYFHVFTYSERPNTEAAVMDGKVPSAERAERSKMLRSLSEKKKRAFYEARLGQARPVLWEAEKKEGYILGFTDNYIKVKLPYTSNLVNQITRFELSSIGSDGIMKGSLVSKEKIA